MAKKDVKRSGLDRREKSNKRAESIIDYFTSKEDEKRSGKDRRKSNPPDSNKKK